MGNAKSKRKSELTRSASVKGHYLKYVDILKEIQVPLLAKLNTEERERLGQHLEMKEYAKGEVIIQQGDVGHGFFIMVEGKADVTRHNEEVKSEEMTIGGLKEGDYFGEAALINNARRNATIRASAPTTCLYLDRQSFNKLFTKDRLNVQFAKRNAVSAEMVSGDDTRRFSVVPPDEGRKKKTDAQRKLILEAVRDNLLFSGLNEEHRDGIVDQMWRTDVKEGVSVIKQGDRGDNLYVVESGTFDIFVTKGQTTRKVAERGGGTCFGELALMYNAPRAATVTAASDAVVWVVDRFTFRRILANVSDTQLHEYEAFLRKVELLAPLSSSERSKIAEALEEVDFAPGATIIKQGDPGDSMYILRAGEASCTIDGVEVKRYVKGDYFGERALLKNEPRAATIAAVTGVKLLELDRNAFSLLLGPLEDIMNSRLEDYRRASQSALGGAAKGDASSGGAAAAASGPSESLAQGKDIARSDLKIIGTLGKGSFGHVQLVKHKKTGKTYALKAVSKYQIVQTGQQGHILSEKRVMEQLNHPFLIRLFNTYKDRDRLYFLLEVSMGGELFSVLRARTFFDEDTARFYAAQVVLAFEHMHSKDIIYRDLKPENLLLDSRGYIKVTDFGFAKVVQGRTYTLCGTPDYLAPEIVAGKGHGKGVDWWTLGILIYEMLSSYPPFYDEDPMKTYAKIMHGRITFPTHFSKEAVHLITKLLNHKPTKRLGVVKGGAQQVKSHAWFAGFDWDALLAKKMKAPIVPKIKDDLDLSNFDDYPEDDDVHPYQDTGTNWDAEF